MTHEVNLRHWCQCHLHWSCGRCTSNTCISLFGNQIHWHFGNRLKNAKWEDYIWQLSYVHCRRHIPLFPRSQVFLCSVEHHQILLLAKNWHWTSSMTPFGTDRNFHEKQSFKFINGQFTRWPEVFIRICTVKCKIHLLCRNLTEVVKGDELWRAGLS
jgi:hypothetical protein